MESQPMRLKDVARPAGMKLQPSGNILGLYGDSGK